MAELRLDTTRAIVEATARALDLRADLRASRLKLLAPEDLVWLADIACAALLLTEPDDLDIPAWLAAADEVDAMPGPAWLADLQGVPDA